MNVNTIFVSDIINEKRGYTENGRKIYTLNDIYPHADLVTYPSDFEGFGNAFLEAIYFRKPILVNRYSIYTFDIEPKGFTAIEIDGYITDKAMNTIVKSIIKPVIEEMYKIGCPYKGVLYAGLMVTSEGPQV